MERDPVPNPARDPVRDRLREQLWQSGVSLAEASLAIGRNKAYLQQYLARGMPRVLSFQDSEALGTLLGCDPQGLRHAELPAPKPWKKKPAGHRPAAHHRRRRDGGRGRRRSRRLERRLRHGEGPLAAPRGHDPPRGRRRPRRPCASSGYAETPWSPN